MCAFFYAPAYEVSYDYAYGVYVNSGWEKLAKDLLRKDSEGKKTEADIVTFEHDGKKGYYLVYDETEESRKFYILQDIGFDVFAQITIDTKDVSTAPNELVEEYILNLPLNITVPTAFDIPAELAKYEGLKNEYVSIDEEANLKITYYVDVVKEIDTGKEYVWGVRRTEQTYKSVGLSRIRPSRAVTIEEFEAEYGSLEEILAKIK